MTNANSEWLCHVLSLKRLRARSDAPYLFVLIRVHSWLNEKQIGASVRCHYRIANFFADFTYEGARGIVGPFLGSLGASAAIVGFVAGLGELMGYGLRSVSGYFADKSRRHWGFAFAGYAVNMLAVPALALAGRWPVAASLVMAERVGRGIRKPTVEAMLSYAGKSIGAGWVFGLNEALDQAKNPS